MLLKAGVDISRLKSQIRRKLNIIERLVKTCSNEELVITSTYEGNHMASSFHYADLAIDIRKTNKPEQMTKLLREKLGDDFDIVLEYNHIHIEYDPVKGNY